MELNEVIQEKLETFSHNPSPKWEGSRAACFAEEKLFLRPLPATPFELAVWKMATVQYNYHISVERMNYSVPYEYTKRQVDVRLTRTTVEISAARAITDLPGLHEKLKKDKLFILNEWLLYPPQGGRGPEQGGLHHFLFPV